MSIIDRFFKKEERSSIANDFINANDLDYRIANVTPDTSLVLSAVQGCVRVISEDIASLPLHVYKSSKNGKEKAKDNPLYNILHLQPNEWQDSFTFFQTAMTHLLLWGNCYVEIVYKRGQVEQLFIIHPELVTKVKVNNKIWYKIKLQNEERFIKDEYMMHLMALTKDGFNGISPIQEAVDVFDLTYSAQRFGVKFFQNGMNAGGVLEHPGVLKDAAYEKLKSSFERRNGGLENSHRLMILEEGMKYTQKSVPPNHAQMLETRRFQVEDIARIFRVPLHLIQSLDHATNNNIEHQSLDFVIHTLRPWLVRWEKMFKIKLFKDTEYFAEFGVDGLLRGDYKTRMEGYSIARQNGFLTVNEIRSLENLNSVPSGDTFLQPLNMVEVGKEPAKEPQKEQKSLENREITAKNEEKPDTFMSKVVENRDKNAKNRSKVALNFRPLMQKAFEDIAKREKADIMRQLEKIKNKQPEDIITYIEKFYSTHDEYMRGKMLPVSESLAKILDEMAADEINSEPNEKNSKESAQDFTDTYIEKYIIRHKGQLISLINENREEGDPEYIELMEERVVEWVEKQPEKSSLETIIQLAGFIVSMAFFSRDRDIIWINTGNDTCPYCRNMNGTVIKKGQYFAQDGSSVLDMQINGSKRHPPLHQGCVCMVGPA
jgi:HK97 family phage portal protein